MGSWCTTLNLASVAGIAPGCAPRAPQYDQEEGRVRKCNFCVDQIDKGNSPVCVTSCPMRCYRIGPLAEIAARPGATIAIQGSPYPTGRSPHADTGCGRKPLRGAPA